jgi:hypothetical protein
MSQAERLGLMTYDDARAATLKMHEKVNQPTKTDNWIDPIRKSKTMRTATKFLRHLGLPAALGVSLYQGYRAATDPKGPLVFDGSSLKDRPRKAKPNPYLSNTENTDLSNTVSNAEYPEIPDLKTIHDTLYLQ